jgi:hypothetical protein
LRQAALIAGFGYLLSPLSYAELSIYPKLVRINTYKKTGEERGIFAPAITCAT